MAGFPNGNRLSKDEKGKAKSLQEKVSEKGLTAKESAV